MGLLVAENVRKVYGGRAVVGGVSISVSRGQITGLLGPNGAGKTTTFYMVVGAVRPDSGTIRLDGEDITRLPMHMRARRGIGYLAQEASIFRDLTVWDNVMAILEFRSMSRAERNEKCQGLLEELSLMHVKDSLGRALSGGERRRAEIARTLASDPAFILLDEPFAGVDPIAVGEIQKIVDYLKDKGLGILITDHNVRETLSICDHTYVMNAGEILVEGVAEDIISNPDARKIYLGENFEMVGTRPERAVMESGEASRSQGSPAGLSSGGGHASPAPPRAPVAAPAPSAPSALQGQTTNPGFERPASQGAAVSAGSASAGSGSASPAPPSFAPPPGKAAPQATAPIRTGGSAHQKPAPPAAPQVASQVLSAWPPEPGKPLVTPEGDTVGLAEPPGGDPLFGDPPARRTGTHDADPGDEDEGGIAWPAPPPARGGRS